MDKSERRSLGGLTLRLLRVAGPVKGMLALSTLASIIGNVSHMGLMGFGALLILSSAQLASGEPLQWGILMFISALLIVVCRYLEGYISHAGAYRLLADMRVKMFETLRVLAPACLMDRQKGDILSIAVADIETIEFFFAHTIGPLFTVILLPTITLMIAGMNSPLFVAALLPIYLVISIILPLVAINTGRQIGVNYRVRIGELKSLVLESVNGLKDIQIFNIGQQRSEQVTHQTEEINKAAHALTMHRQLVTSMPTFFVYLARIMVIGVASRLALEGQSNPAGIVVLSFVVSASFSSTQSLTTVISNLLETYAAAERLFTLEDTLPEVQEIAHPKRIERIQDISFNDVTFSYTDTSPSILDKMSLHLRAGDKVGIVGESGIGKSTIIRLLLRFWEPKGGSITVDGIPLGNLSLQSLRSRIAMLEQDTFIFNDTIAANIALGKPEASHEDIVAAAKRARIDQFIMTLPDGYDTQMGELGGRLSGGEKQRIGIARAMMMDPDILVMDEPTSSLDVLNEKGLLKTLEEEYADKTILVVSHRASTLTGCNRILKLEAGKLVDLAIAAN